MKTKLLLLLVVTLFSTTLSAQTIYSTSSGGNWNDTMTWVGYTIPTTSNDVVINGTVNLNWNSACHNLSVNSGAVLECNNYSNELSVYGNLINAGTIQDGSYDLILYLYGNLQNSGVLSNNFFGFTGSSDKTVISTTTISPGQIYAQGGTLFLGSDISMENCNVGTNVYLDMNGYNLSISNGSFQGTLYGGSGDLTLTNGAYINVSQLYEEVNLYGTINVNNSTAHGDVILYGTLQNHNSYSYSLTCLSNFTNYGTVQNNAGYSFELSIKGNLINYGTINNLRVYLYGSYKHQVSSTNPLAMQYLQFSYNDTLDMAGDLLFQNCEIQANTGIINMNGHKLAVNSGTINTPKIYSGNGILSMTGNSRILQTKLYEAVELQNTIQLDGGNKFYGPVTNTDTIQNYDYNITSTFYDTLENNGIICNHSGYALTLYCNGNLYNNGELSNTSTYLNGTTIQELGTSQAIECAYFYSQNSTAYISAVSDLYFSGTYISFSSNYALHLNANTLYLNNVQFLSTNIYTGDGAINASGNTYIASSNIHGDIDLWGKVALRGGNTAYNQVHVVDTLCNSSNYDHEFTVLGKLVNDGVIMNDVYLFSIYSEGDISNNGSFINSYLYFSGDSVQHLETTLPIEVSSVNSTDTAGVIVADGNLKFNGSNIYLNEEELILEGYDLILEGGHLNNGNVHTLNGRFNFSQGARLFGSNIFGSVQALGKVLIDGDSNYFYGELTVADTLSNYSGYTYTVHVLDNFINNGVIQNNVYSLIVECSGNLTNNGQITNYAINLSGTGTQELTCTEPIACSYLSSTDTTGNLSATSNLWFENCQINLQGEELLMNGHQLSIDDQYIYQAKIYTGNGSFRMSNNGHMEDISVYGDISLYGDVLIYGDNNHFYGVVTVEDSLRNYSSYTYPAWMHNDLINNGYIGNNNYNMVLQIEGDLTNNGQIENYSINLFGTGTQELTCTEPITCSYLSSTDTTGSLSATSNLWFENCQVNLQDEELFMNGNQLSIDDQYIYQAKIYTGNGNLRMSNNGHMEDISVYGDISLYGDVLIYGDNNHFYGVVTVEDSLRNYSSYTYTAWMHNDLINNGYIGNNNYNMVLQIEGDLTNNGQIENYSINLLGTGTQELTCTEPIACSYLSSTDTVGSLSATSNLWFENCQVNLQGEELFMNGHQLSINDQYIYQAKIYTGNGSLRMSNNGHMEDISVYGDISFFGDVLIYGDNNHFYGVVTVEDSLRNYSSYTYTAWMHNDLINNGYIGNNNYNMALQIEGNLLQNGIWENYQTIVRGSTDQFVYFMNSNPIGGSFLMWSNVPGATSYEWTKDGVSLVGETVGAFTEESGETLYSSVPVSSPYFGTYYCSTNNGASRNIVLMPINPPIADAGADQSICAGEQATIYCSASDGQTPYSYLWSNGQSGNTIVVSPATSQTYMVTITDALGNTDSDTLSVTVFQLPLVDLGADFSLCTGEMAMLDVFEPGNYLWSDGSTLPFLEVSASGTYSVTLTDANGCSGSDEINITFNALPTVDLGSDMTLCEGEYAFLEIYDPGTYVWSNGSTQSYIEVFSSGTYGVTLTDSNGCSNSDEINITFNALPTVDLGPDQQITSGNSTTLDAGSGFASYLWSTGESTQSIQVSTAGDFSVTVADASSCENSDTVSVSITTLNSPIADLGADQSICSGESVSIYCSVTNALPPVSYLWSNGQSGNTLVVSPASTQNYSVTITDALNQTASDTITISVNPLPVVDLGYDQNLCEGEFTVLELYDPGTYVWSNGSTQNYIELTTSGTYTVTFTDTNGCSGSDEVNVTFNPPPYVEIGPDIFSCAGNIEVLQSTTQDTYLWSNGSTNSYILVTTSGTYSITVSDINGCTGSGAVTVTFIDLPQVNLGPDVDLSFGNTLNLDAGSGFASYLWSNGQTSQSILITDGGTYSVTVSDANGCENSDEMVVNIIYPGGPYADLGPDESICEGGSLMLNCIASDGTPPYSYLWSTGQSGNSIQVSPLSSQSYSVTVVDANNQSGSDVIEVTVNSLPQIDLGPDQSIATGSSIVLDAGTGFATYLWSTGESTQSITVSAGVYGVSVSDANSCTGSDEIVILNLPASGPGWEVLNTGVMHTILIPDTALLLVDGVPLQSGDYIGVFYDSSGTLSCAGYTMWDSQTTSITAWGDDIVTPEKDGFVTGETLNFQIWLAGNQMVYNATAQYMPQPLMPNQGFYAVNGLSGILALEATSVDYQYINLPQGWSYFSTYIDLFEPGIDSLLSDIVQEVIISKDGDGNTYWPQWGLNTIGNMEIGKGYQVKVSTAQTVVAEGIAVVPELTSFTIPLGWSFLGYLRQAPAMLTGVLSPIEGHVIIMKDSDGNTWWPQWGLNTIGNMNPGEAYPIKLDAAVQYSYPANSMQLKTCDLSMSLPRYFGTLPPGANSMTLGIPSYVLPSEVRPDDELGVFSPNGQLVGSAVVQNNFTAITIWGSDDLDASLPGLHPGEEFLIRYWSKTNEQTEILDLTCDGDISYAANKIMLATELLPGTESQELTCKVFPNPAHNEIRIALNLEEDEKVNLKIFNAHGQCVQFIQNVHSSWIVQPNSIQCANLPAGIYLLQTEAEGKSAVCRFELIK